MQTVKVPIFGTVYRNVDGVERNDLQEILVDGYLSELGATVKRPGLSSWLDLGLTGAGAVDGLYWWAQQECVIAVAGGRTFKITYDSKSPVATSLDATGLLATRQRPYFTTDGTYVFIVAGGSIYYTNGTAALAAISDADAPTTATSIAYIDGYLLATKTNSSRFYWSNIYNPLTWTATDYANAERSADYIQRVLVREREILFFGESTLEIWQNDGVTPFSPVSGNVVEVGCIAPASIISTDRGVFWLNDKRRIMHWGGNSLNRLSTPYDKEIESYDSPEACTGYAIEIDGKLFLAWKFLGDTKMLVCNYEADKNNWSEWGNWDSENGVYSPWLGQSYCWCPNWGVHLVGSQESDKIYTLSLDNYDDDGNEIRLLRRSGHIDYGTNRCKRCLELRLRVKRGHAGTTRTPQLMVRWRDDGRRWSNKHWIDLGDQGETEIIARLWPGGIYRTRQYEFSCTDSVPLTFLDAEEDIEVLR